jgi:hypothetical protein
MFDLDRKFNLISLINIFLILLMVIQIVNFKNFVFPNIQNEVRYSSELQKESKFIDFMEVQKNIETIDLPLLPEFKNLKLLNKIISISNESEPTYIVGQNQIFFYYILSGVLFTVFFLKINNKKLIMFSYLVLSNAYIFLVFEFKFLYLIIFILVCFSSLIYKKISENKVNENYLILFILSIVILLQASYLNKEVIDWDISTYLIAGQDINRGNLPYLNQFELKPVLIFYIYSFIDSFSGGDLRFVKQLNDIPIIICTYFIYKTISSNGKVVSAMLASLYFAFMTSIEYFGATGYTELYAVVPLAYAYYLVETKNFENYYFIGFLIGLSTLINHASIFYYFAFLLFLFFNKKEKIIKFTLGFSSPHFFFLIIYLINASINVYIKSNLFLPLGYSQNSNSSLSAYLTAFYFTFQNFSLVSKYFYVFMIIFLLSSIYVLLSRRGQENNSVFKYVFIASFVLYYFSGTISHHLIFLVFFSSFLFESFDRYTLLNKTMFVLIFISIFSTLKIDKGLENLINFQSVDSNYRIKIISEYIHDNIEYSSILALEDHLILYYLNLENSSFIIHPTTIFYDYINEAFNDLEGEDQIFQSLLAKNPTLIICNEIRFSFCKNVPGYKEINNLIYKEYSVPNGIKYFVKVPNN